MCYFKNLNRYNNRGQIYNLPIQKKKNNLVFPRTLEPKNVHQTMDIFMSGIFFLGDVSLGLFSVYLYRIIVKRYYWARRISVLTCNTV